MSVDKAMLMIQGESAINHSKRFLDLTGILRNFWLTRENNADKQIFATMKVIENIANKFQSTSISKPTLFRQ